MYEEDRQQLIGQFRDNYPNLVRADGSYIGWVSSFHGATYDGQPVSWDLDQSRYRFGLYCLASAWSRSGRWEGPVRLLMAMSMEDGDYLEPTYWANGNPNRIAEDFEYLVKRGGAAAQIPRARNASARQDCVASFMTIGREFDFIEETVQRLHGGQGDPGETVRRLRSIIGTGFGNRAWRIKIPLILRELRCAGWDGIPGESCCVPDIRVANTYARYGCFLPGDLLMASAKIYEHFGDLFDLPPFFAPDHDMRVMRTNQGARTTLIDPEILMNRELIEEDNVATELGGLSGEDFCLDDVEGCSDVVCRLREVFGDTVGASEQIPTQRNSFQATLREDGIEIDKLPGQRILPWGVFCAALVAIRAGGGEAKKGNLQGGVLGSNSTPVSSVEGTIASAVYNLVPGMAGTRRVTYVAALLNRADVADNLHGVLRLRQE